MRAFEYKTAIVDAGGFFGGKVDSGTLDKTLNDLGRDGWELTEIIASNQSYGQTRYIICVFKREL